MNWIKCADKMPEEGTYLAYGRQPNDENDTYVIMARYRPTKTTKCKDGFYTRKAEWTETGCCGGSIKPEEIIYWMEIPEGPYELD